MKKLMLTIGVPVLLGFGFLMLEGCDKLEQPYAVKKDITVDTTKRKVLLEDYTGIKCVNCPAATQLAESLQELYKGQVILMTIHAGFYSQPDPNPPFNEDFRVQEGVAWFNDFNLQLNPMGMVNRTVVDGSYAIKSNEWPDMVNELSQQPRVATIDIDIEYTPTSRHHVNTEIHTHFLEELPGAYNLSVCILEDSIVGWQKNNDTAVGPVPDIENYVFNDMLRGVINGTYGEQLTAAVDTSEHYIKSYMYTLNEAWDPKHLSVVAFVFNQTTKEVIQVEKKHMISE